MIVILHGWSDESGSFGQLADRIRGLGLPGAVRDIHLGDYVTMDDNVHYADITRALARAWHEHGLPTAPRSVDLVVHSTGALVARHWLTSQYQADRHPVRRLVMLAPANFGSPLAHKGRSFLGRVVKGFSSQRRFHTGARLLEGLELASPFTWDLAIKDRFDPNQLWYGPGRILATVLVGTAGYTGIAAAANQVGSDGTVLVASANLEPLYLDMDFASDPKAPTIREFASNGRVAFCRIPRDNHSTLVLKDRGPKNPALIDRLREALTVTDASFDDHVLAMARHNAQARGERNETRDRHTQGYQNTVVRVVDDTGQFVHDYFVEAFAKKPGGTGHDDALTRRIQEDVLVHAHTHSASPAFRALRFNCDVLQEMLLDREVQRPLHLRITAQPDIERTGSVGYRTLNYRDVGAIRIDPPELGRIFRPDRTVLINLRIHREQVNTLVRFKRHR